MGCSAPVGEALCTCGRGRRDSCHELTGAAPNLGPSLRLQELEKELEESLEAKGEALDDTAPAQAPAASKAAEEDLSALGPADEPAPKQRQRFGAMLAKLPAARAALRAQLEERAAAQRAAGAAEAAAGAAEAGSKAGNADRDAFSRLVSTAADGALPDVEAAEVDAALDAEGVLRPDGRAAPRVRLRIIYPAV